ncbi:hypothetical protein TCAL_15020 [Tigriopus californicus]|uniref:Tr-type G domain-containing protein n=1 Tax=Tigriopus californicus TaxID=6832 RepID=A0A553NXA6_TIGCA|nr:hypothetical protein TCAL_15020 [Tigriopus californicus]
MLNLATIGSSQHGKTSLSSLLTRASHDLFPEIEAKAIEDIDNTLPERENSHSVNATHLELQTHNHLINLSDLPGHRNYIKNFLAHLADIDVALMVVNTNEGVLPGLRHQYDFIKHCRVQKVLPILNFSDEADLIEAKDLMTLDLEEFMDETELSDLISMNLSKPNEDAQLLLKKLDSLKAPIRSEDKPLFWPLQNVGSIPNRGTFIADGTVSVGNTIDVFYEGQTTKSVVRDCEIFRRKASKLQSGDRGGAFVKLKIENLNVRRGAVAFESAKSDYRLTQDIIVELMDEVPPLGKNSETLVHYLTNVYPKVTVSDLTETKAKLRFSQPILTQPNEPMFLRQGSNIQRALVKSVTIYRK